MEKTCEYDVCTGCMACADVCPKSCIEFITGDFGHIYPKIDQNKCIDCNRCRAVCPELSNENFRKPEKAYAAIAKDKEEYKKSTSGGAAWSFSEKIIRDGGVVYGCASLPKAKINHIRVDNPDDLHLLQGSKYVQSDLQGIYKSIIKDLATGKKVLFTGTPCQCAAVRKLLPNKSEDLYTVEIICHGVPSQKFLKDYLSKKGCDISEIESLKFRTDKGYQIKAFSKGEVIFESNSLSDKPWSDAYCSTFYYCFSSRPSCFKCRFAQEKRASDITIGDFWGLGKMGSTDEIPQHPYGISVVIPYTEKGKRLLSECGNLNLYPRPVEEAIAGNDQLRHPSPYRKRNRIFDALRKYIGVLPAFRIAMADKIVRNLVRTRIINRIKG